MILMEGAPAANQLGDDGVAEISAAVRSCAAPLTSLSIWSELHLHLFEEHDDKQGNGRQGRCGNELWNAARVAPSRRSTSRTPEHSHPPRPLNPSGPDRFATIRGQGRGYSGRSRAARARSCFGARAAGHVARRQAMSRESASAPVDARECTPQTSRAASGGRLSALPSPASLLAATGSRS